MSVAEQTVLPKNYFDRIVQQKFILAHNDEGEVAGFMTFVNGYECPELSSIGPSNYITTICVANSYRGRGIMGDLYKFAKCMLPEKYTMPYLSTRTWNQNGNHLKGLKRQGFNLILTVKDHRGPGVDTMYFAYPIEGKN